MTNPCVTAIAPGQVELRDLAVPEPGPGQIRVDGICSLISSGTDLTLASGDFPPGGSWAAYARYPVHLGYSHVGRIEAVGESVRGLAPGDLVLSMAPHARHVVVGAERCYAVPGDVTPEQAAWGILAEIALGGVRRAGITLGESALILGLGPVGQLAAQLARLSGARPVIAADPVEARGVLALALGAHHAVGDAAARVPGLAPGGVDLAIDATGHPAGITTAAPLVRDLGRIVILGSPKGPVTIDFQDHIHARSLQIIGAHNSAHPRTADPNHPWTVARDVALCFHLISTGELKVDPLLSHRHVGVDAPAVFAALLADRSQTMGVLLDWRT